MGNGDESVLVQLRGGVVGPIPVSKLRQLKGFTLQTMVSVPGSEKWAPAFRVLNLKSYFDGRFDITTPNGAAPVESVAQTFVFNSEPTGSIAKSAIPVLPQPRIISSATDQWFKRLLILNLLLVGVGVAAWQNVPMRATIQREFKMTVASLPPALQNFCGSRPTAIRTAKKVPPKKVGAAITTVKRPAAPSAQLASATKRPAAPKVNVALRPITPVPFHHKSRRISQLASAH